MGCAGSKDDAVQLDTGSKQPSAISKAAAPSLTAPAPSLTKPPMATQPLFSGAAAAAPDGAAAEQPVPSAAPAALPSPPAAAAPMHSAPLKKPARLETTPSPAVPTDPLADGHDSDKESNWDQCSTSHLNNEAEEGAAKEGWAEPPPVESPGSVMDKVLGQSEAKVLEADLDSYRETTTLRIDKVKGCMFVNQYLVLKFLGRGACGKVFLCLNTRDLHLYAMKAVRKVDLESALGPNGAAAPRKRNPLEDLKREIMIMKKMKHPNIVTLSEVIDDPGGSKLLLVMEYMEGGPVLTRESLEKRDKLPEPLALVYFRDMIKALDYLHCQKVVHGDLKPENVLMSASGEVKLSDFGCSKIFASGNEYLERCNGTPAFLAPEMMKPNTRYRGRPTDVYALGACLYTLLFGRIPFSATNLYKLFQVVQNDPVKYPEDVPISDNLRALLQAMLTKNPRERITLQEVMRHPWVTMGGRFPLRANKDLKVDESQELHSGIASGQSFQQLNPRPDFVGGLAALSRHGRTFSEGDIIMRQGDTGTYLMYIMEGTVDVLVKWTPPTTTRRSSQMSGGSSSRGPAQNQGRATGPVSIDVPQDDTETMQPIADEAARQHRSNLLRASGKAREFVKSLQLSAGDMGAGFSGPQQLLIAQRGQGELVGEMALFSKSLARCATVRCRTRVVARIVTHEQLVEALVHQPAGRNQVREGIWRKESEIAMVEALGKLAGVQEIVAASLDMVRDHGLAGPNSSGNMSAKQQQMSF